MTTEIMTVHKALAELKLLDKRIEDTISKGIYCVANRHGDDKVNGIPIDESIKIIQGSYDKVTNLINRRKAIKRAVALSNAVTKVKIADVDYTIAEAIEMKNHGVEFDKALMETMQDNYETAQSIIKLENGKDLQERADKYVSAIYGGREGKTNTTDIEKIKSDFLKANQYELIDPLHILDKIAKLEENINNFMAEVDSALSVSNALTEIIVEY